MLLKCPRASHHMRARKKVHNIRVIGGILFGVEKREGKKSILSLARTRCLACGHIIAIEGHFNLGGLSYPYT